MNYQTGHVDPWWDQEFKKLDYLRLPHRDDAMVQKWLDQGYQGTLNGAFYGDNRPMPEWTQKFIPLLGWENVGFAMYRMDTGDVLPVHSDHYNTYRRIHNITDNSTIWRCIVFLEDWKSGHYLEIDNTLIPQWRAGDYVIWNYDVPHMAANLGLEPRYTLQLTGTRSKP